MATFYRETNWGPFPHPHGPSSLQSARYVEDFDSWRASYPFDQWQDRYRDDSTQIRPHKVHPRTAVAGLHPSFANTLSEPTTMRGGIQQGTRSYREGGPSPSVGAYTWDSSDTVCDQRAANGHSYVHWSRNDEENRPGKVFRPLLRIPEDEQVDRSTTCSPATISLVESRDYPDLHPILARDSTTLLYDVRYPPHTVIPHPQYELFRLWNATRTPAAYMRIVCPYFPWPIDIAIVNDTRDSPGAAGAKSASTRTRWPSDASGVCVRDVWSALHAALQDPLTGSEWASIASLVGAVGDEMSRRNRALRAARWREVNEGGMRVLRRVDWLGSRTKFCGLYKDRELEERLRLPFEAAVKETWVADFTWNR